MKNTMMNNIKQITFKELKDQFNSLNGYLLAILFLGLLYFMSLKAFFIFQQASIRGLFDWIPWLYAIFIPAITMGSFAKEFESQTIEYLITKPIKKTELIIGKLLGAFGYVSIVTLLTLPLLYFVSRLGDVDNGEVFASYLGALLLAFALCSIGIAISSLFKNQIMAFITSAVVIFLLIIVSTDFTATNLPLSVVKILSNLSVMDHYRSIIRGVLQPKDFVYFVIIAIITYTITFLNLAKIQYSKAGSFYKAHLLQIFIGLLLCGSVYIAADFAKGRIDFTTNQKYTLTEATKEILQKDPDIVIEFYASPSIPQSFEYKLNEAKYFLDDYQRLGGGKISVQYIDPTGKEQELAQKGILPTDFVVYGQDQGEVKRGYLGLLIKEKDNDQKFESISIIDDQILNNFEYEISKRINLVKNATKTKIAVASGNGERGIFEQYGTLQKLMESDYDFESIVFPAVGSEDPNQSTEKPTYPNLDDFKVILISNPTNAYSEKSIESIKNFINKGGSVIYLADTLEINNQLISVDVPSDIESRGKLLESLGVTINKNMVYDLKSHTSINMATSQGAIARVNYPPIIYAQNIAKDSIKNSPDVVLIGWGSSINADSNWRPILQTTNSGLEKTENFNIDPTQEYSNENVNTYILGVAKNLDKENSSEGKTIVISTARIFDNEFIAGSQENALYALALFENLSDTTGLASIRSKNVLENQIIAPTTLDKLLVVYGAPISSLLLLGLIGINVLIKRKQLQKEYAVR